ncbi:MAG: purine-nucleoside phosphorylase [Flavobacteriales bacterium]
MNTIEQLEDCTEWLRNHGITQPEVGIVLGSGLGDLALHIEVEKSFSYNVIPHFPIATVEFHFGKLIYGKLGGKQVLACQGRFHYYEGHSIEDVVLPVRVMKMLGAKCVLLSNASGALNLSYKKGELMLINDHINLQPDNPLRGNNVDELGPRFPDMTEPYSRALNDKLRKIAAQNNITLHEGVYVSVQGPNLETRAEYRMMRLLGGDAVGMSTAPEVIACNHMSLPCCCLSVITDVCDPDNLKPTTVDEIIATAKRSEAQLSKLYTELIMQL